MNQSLPTIGSYLNTINNTNSTFVKAYPNPSFTQTTFQLSKELLPAQLIKIYNSFG